MSLKAYQGKRDFRQTSEPKGRRRTRAAGNLYVIQKHVARRPHYDFRLELDGVLKSWAVPKGPSANPADKRLAVQVEDHPIEYGEFEGVIPKGEYGGGTVMLWDRGRWETTGEARGDYARGKLKFNLHGEKLRGAWTLVRMKGRAADGDKNWLLIKENDAGARTREDPDVLEERPESVASQRSMDQIAADHDTLWQSGRAVKDKKPSGKTKPAGNPKKARGQQSVDDGELRVADLPEARKASQPETFKPQLATLVTEVPTGEHWLHEIKYDGYRVLCISKAGKARLLSRNGNDLTGKLGRLAKAVADIPVKQAILDGELVALKPDGATDFQALQNALKEDSRAELAYYVFDLPYCDGYDLRRTPLIERKRLLRRLLESIPGESPLLRYSDHIEGHGDSMYQHACSYALEGIISKRADGAYQSRRSASWVKVKCTRRQEFVVGAYTDPEGSRKHFGALLLGYYDDDGRLIYCGRVGTGFNAQALRAVHQQLTACRRKASPFHNLPRDVDTHGAHWVRPALVVEVAFAAWTDDGRLRHASFQGVRVDKSSQEVTREEPVTIPARPKRPAIAAARSRSSPRASISKTGRSQKEQESIAGQRLTHPDRVLYPEQGLTKRDLARFYEHIADWILPHVAGRPLSLVRCPRGRGHACFFQKHITESLPDALQAVSIQEKTKRSTYVTLCDVSGLVALVQLGVLEIHPWGSRADKLERPDVLVFDLDPSPELAWTHVVRGALTVRDRLIDIGLRSFVKTSGGKGLHVVAPLARRSAWDDFKSFSKAVAVDIARREPKRYVATASKAKREGRIFIDWLRNGRGATSVAAYSTRARANAPVSTPLNWSELDDLDGAAEYTLANLPRRLDTLKQDPWADFFKLRQSITAAMRKELPFA